MHVNFEVNFEKSAASEKPFPDIGNAIVSD